MLLVRACWTINENTRGLLRLMNSYPDVHFVIKTNLIMKFVAFIIHASFQEEPPSLGVSHETDKVELSLLESPSDPLHLTTHPNDGARKSSSSVQCSFSKCPCSSCQRTLTRTGVVQNSSIDSIKSSRATYRGCCFSISNTRLREAQRTFLDITHNLFQLRSSYYRRLYGGRMSCTK